MSGPRHDDSPPGAFEKQWRARFEQFASKGDEDAAIAGWSESGLAARLRNFQRVWPGDRDGALWLDVGCGAATYARHIAGRGMTVIGMDYSLPTLVKARTRSPAIAGWALGDVMRLPLKPAAFDGAMCFGVLQAVGESDAPLRELAAVVKAGGQVWVDALNGWCVPNLWDRCSRRLAGRPVHLRYESARALKRAMRHNGFAALRLYWLPILPGRWQRFQWLLETRAARALLRYVPPLGMLFSHAFVLCGRKRET